MKDERQTQQLCVLLGSLSEVCPAGLSDYCVAFCILSKTCTSTSEKTDFNPIDLSSHM